MTEEEAKTKWCPFARVMRMKDSTISGNMGVFDDNKTYARLGHCFGSECMAWRWTTNTDDSPKHGFCGLAGKP